MRYENLNINNFDRRVIVAIILISAVLVVYYYQSIFFSSQQTHATRIVWERTGGFAGLDEKLELIDDGSATLFSNLVGVMEFSLSEDEWEALVKTIVESKITSLDTSYGPKTDVADFFSYKLEVTTEKKTYFLEWVDDWASEKTLPDELKNFEEHMLSIIQGDGFGAIEGTISDNKGEPIDGLVVSIVNGSIGYPEMAVITNYKGFYRLGSIPPGIFTIGVHNDISKIMGNVNVHVLGGKTSILNITINVNVDGEKENSTSSDEPLDNVLEGVAVGRRALDFSVVGLQGDTFTLSEHRGEVIILEFMTTWCGFCKLQHAELNKLHQALGNLTIVTIEIDAALTKESFTLWALEQEYDWFVGHSTDLGWSYWVTGVPTVLLIDGEGIIRHRGSLISSVALEALVRLYK
jgi:thiol-disulfide isomerase/thioredoxin